MAQHNEFRMPTFEEKQALMRQAEVLRAQAIADGFSAMRAAVLRLFAARRVVAH